MVDILHRIGVKGSSPDDVYAALTTLEGLSGWWARDTTGVTDVGGVIAFRFVPGGFDMKVVELVPGKQVLWEVVEGPAEGAREAGELLAQPGGRLPRRALRAPGLGGAGRVHASLQHQVGDVPAQPQAAPGDRRGRARPGRRADQRLALRGG